MEKIICQSCGAEFDANETKCPYCGFLHAEGMEKKYMSDLEDKREALDVVDDAARAEYKDDAKRHSKKTIKIILIVAAIILVIVGAAKLFDYLSMRSPYSEEEELLWQQETFPILDEYYEAGNYDACWDIIYSKDSDGHDVWEWQHYNELSETLDAELEEPTS